MSHYPCQFSPRQRLPASSLGRTGIFAEKGPFRPNQRPRPWERPTRVSSTSTVEGTPPFSANGLSFLREFHKDHSAIDIYGLTPENREIVKLALRNAKGIRHGH
ncbi:unnamed protein product [Prunus brigantina]